MDARASAMIATVAKHAINARTAKIAMTGLLEGVKTISTKNKNRPFRNG